jgi:hypothetical protein
VTGQWFPEVLRFPPPKKLTPRYSRNIVESGVKHINQPNLHSVAKIYKQ